MNILITIAIVVVAIGAVLAVAGVIAAVQARRNESRNAEGTEALGGSPDAAKVTTAPAVKIEKVCARQRVHLPARFNCC
jgi:type II secretory pathway pseudopilin PulG